MVADVLASEYGWSRECIWWQMDFAEICWYLHAIIHRKAVEAGKGQEAGPVTDELDQLWQVIEEVKAEYREGRR